MAYFAPELTLIGSASGVVLGGKKVPLGDVIDHINQTSCLPAETCPEVLSSSTEW